ncbi:MAG TPA: DNA topoisomerase IV [Flavobacteriaceae bacterium]|nr:DNA topoisomerase IV [Flavobacteriaceae bacterium]
MSPFFRVLTILIVISTSFSSCFNKPRDCAAYKTGRFTFSTAVGGQIETSEFQRHNSFEVEYYKGKQDTSDIRWINDCEYIVQKRNPKNRAEEQAIHIKILSTDASGYEFEYKAVGAAKTLKGRVNRS